MVLLAEKIGEPGYQGVMHINFFTVIFLQLFAGFLIALSSLPEWISWIKYLSLFKYSLEVRTELNF